jgi:hypothetical protein
VISTRSSSSSTQIRWAGSRSPRATASCAVSIDPNEIFVRVEFESVAEAKAFGDKVRGSDVLQNVTVNLSPTITEMADQATY